MTVAISLEMVVQTVILQCDGKNDEIATSRLFKSGLAMTLKGVRNEGIATLYYVSFACPIPTGREQAMTGLL